MNYKFPIHTCTGDTIEYIEFSGVYNDDEDTPYELTAVCKADRIFRHKYPDIPTCGQCGDSSIKLSEENHYGIL